MNSPATPRPGQTTVQGNMKAPLYQRLGDQVAQTIVVGSRDAFNHLSREWWWILVASGAFGVAGIGLLALQAWITWPRLAG